MSLSNEAQMIHNFNMSSMSFSQPQSQIGQVAQPASASRLNPKAPEYSSVYSPMQNKNNASALYNGYPVNVPNNMFVANKGAMEVSFRLYSHRRIKLFYTPKLSSATLKEKALLIVGNLKSGKYVHQKGQSFL